MNARSVAALALALWLPVAALAQGFAALGTAAEGFALPHPDRALQFPADHGAHPDFRIEWWYLTANLTGSDGAEYGLQWTLFRSALAPDDQAQGWQSPQLWMGHAALTGTRFHRVEERRARGGIGQAGVTAAPFHAYIDDWEMVAPPDSDGIDRLRVTARGQGFSYALALQAEGPLVLHGDSGYSVKSADGHASHYYSQPRYRATGTIETPSGAVEVTGQAWLDREWSSQPLSADQSGWDWFSLSFDGGAQLMAFRLRDGGAGFSAATWIGADGAASPLPDGAVQMEPLEVTQVAGRAVPTRWRLAVPSRGVAVELGALNPQAWMETSLPYWEGPVRITGSHPGRGYLEMTGYD